MATEKQTPLNLTILAKADQLIAGERQEDYGDKLNNFAQIAMGFQMVLARKLAPDVHITPEDVALLMMQVKIARLAHKPDHQDSLLDVAGYVGCYDKLQQARIDGLELIGAITDTGIL